MDNERDPERPPAIRICLADRHRTMRRALSSMLEREPDLELVAAVATWSELLSLVGKQPIDALLLDHAIVKGSLTESLHTLLSGSPSPSVILMAIDAPQPMRTLAISAGADACLLKDSPPGAIVEAIRSNAARRSTWPAAG